MRGQIPDRGEGPSRAEVRAVRRESQTQGLHLLRLYLVLCLVLLVVGAMMPFVRLNGVLDLRLTTVSLYAFEEGSGLSVVLGVAFTCLVLCTVVAVVVTCAQWFGDLSSTYQRVGRWTSVVLLAGGTAVGFYSLVSSASAMESAAPGLAMLFFLPGAAIFAYMMFSEDFDFLRDR